MKQALAEAFQEEYGEYQILTSDNVSDDQVQKHYEQFSSWDWRYGKSPECEMVRSKRFEWGEVELHIRLKNLFIEEIGKEY